MSTKKIPAPTRRETYTPGFALPKLGLALVGLALIVLAFPKLQVLGRLAWKGDRVLAEAVRVVVVHDQTSKEEILTSDAAVKDLEKNLRDARDRSKKFWIEYRFYPQQDRPVEVRSPIGNMLTSLHPLLDQDGLPYSLRLWVDADAVEALPKAVGGAVPRLPSESVAIPVQFLIDSSGTWSPFGFSTFFIPGILLLFGLAGLFVGLVLWWNAKRPIVLPDLSQALSQTK